LRVPDSDSNQDEQAPQSPVWQRGVDYYNNLNLMGLASIDF
jgi:hypothetical protein